MKEFCTVAAMRLATALMGDAIFTNPFIMGYAWQKGLIPLKLESIMKAIELNAAAVEKNKAAFCRRSNSFRGIRKGHVIGSAHRAMLRSSS